MNMDNKMGHRHIFAAWGWAHIALRTRHAFAHDALMAGDLWGWGLG